MSQCRFCEREAKSDHCYCGECQDELRQWESGVVNEINDDVRTLSDPTSRDVATAPIGNTLGYRGNGFYR